jgi:TonB family protein
MAFRALLFSTNSDTNAAMTAACESAGIRIEACTDIFSAIEKVKSQAFSCVIPDWADQPEASFLLKRARESAQNRETVGIAIVNSEPTAAEMRDNRLDFLIYRPISVQEADEVLAKACEHMKPLGAKDALESSTPSRAKVASDESSSGSSETQLASSVEEQGTNDDGNSDADNEPASRAAHHSIGVREVVAVLLVVTAIFTVWRSRDALQYLAKNPEGTSRVLRESVSALFYMNQTGAMPVSSAGSDAQQDAYFSRNSPASTAQSPALKVAATESTMAETHIPLPKAYDFPLPVPVFEHHEEQPVQRARVAIPESMRNSPPIARPMVVSVNPALLPVSAPQSQPATTQSFNEPVAISEDAARALLVHSVDPTYPPEGLAQKLHGPVVLQASIDRDGAVQDLKIVRGYFILGRSAIAAVKQWRFRPYTLNGHAVSTQTSITVNFSSPGE